MLRSSPRMWRTRFLVAPRGFASHKGLEDTYQRKTLTEHVLLRPDTYIGSTEMVSQDMWVVDEQGGIVRRPMKIVPALLKIVDEILVNAADNKQRDPRATTEIRVDIDPSTSTISVYNNGRTIPIEVHKEEGIYFPELLFGHMLTGSNFDDDDEKIVGGRNGYGAKMANVFSTEFTVEVNNSKQKKYYKQTWRSNMGVCEEPEILPLVKGPSFTRVTFTPDLSKFGMNGLDEDIIGVLRRRVLDLAACVDGVKVYLNGELITSSSRHPFRDYCNQFILASGDDEDSEDENKAAYVRVSDRWHIGIGASPAASFEHVSFVNNINTWDGGTHVEHVATVVSSKIAQAMSGKETKVTARDVRPHLFLFLKCVINNPSFDSQSKTTLTTRKTAFGSTCDIPDFFIKKVMSQTDVVKRVRDSLRKRGKERAERMLLGPKVKGRKILHIPKLDDAYLAGGRRSRECTLILTEGDSAKALAIAGLSEVGRDTYGVFPLRGKMLNVRDSTGLASKKNAEINHVVNILGLDRLMTYQTPDEVATLRYGHVMLMTDQDHDGSHIKGLFINFLHRFWPALVKDKSLGFLQSFVTPLVKATKGKKVKEFFSLDEYERFRATNESAGWRGKYYKGLGTSTSAEAKTYFKNIAKHRVQYEWSKDCTDALIDKAFCRKESSSRKEWLSDMSSDLRVPPISPKMTYSDFVNNELIFHAQADNVRSIPSVMDGLKQSQRKVLHAALRRNLATHEMKVAQFGGYVAEATNYHHGEASLASTITAMAQDFVGSNNVNLLLPLGQFGTRMQGGKDAASSRYTFTKLSPLARHLFCEDDDPLLEYLADDSGDPVEPRWYAPIIPMVLVNGTTGIGTGWSTYAPNHNPGDLVKTIRQRLDGVPVEPLIPWYRGSLGKIVAGENGDFVAHAAWSRKRKGRVTTVTIKDLTPGTWTDSYKAFLGKLCEESGKLSVNGFTEAVTDTQAGFRVVIASPCKDMTDSELSRILKLHKNISCSNMHMFDHQGQLRRYETSREIVDEFYDVRLRMYGDRKAHLYDRASKDLKILERRMKFVELVVSGQLDVRQSKDDVRKSLREAFHDESVEHNSDFDRLLSLPLTSLSHDEVESLRARCQAKLNERDSRNRVSKEDMWRADLDVLLEALTQAGCV